MRRRAWLVVPGVLVLACAGVAAAALLAWPRVAVEADGAALARLTLPGFAGRVTAVEVRGPGGARVPAQLRQGRLWPSGKLDSGERLTVRATVRKPGWAAWLVGHSSTRTFAVTTPVARLRGRWLEAKSGAPLTVAFDEPVAVVAVGRGKPQLQAVPRRVVPLGFVARGTHRAGSVEVAGAARSWERLPAPTRVTWFPARAEAQLLVSPGPGAEIAPAGQIVLTFSRPVAAVLGARRPAVRPATPGRWRLLDAHTIAFQPGGALGFGLGATVHLTLPRTVLLTEGARATATRRLDWIVPPGKTLRLQQLLAQLGYLPLAWQPAQPESRTSARTELAAAVDPPDGLFQWGYPNIPPELEAIWTPGEPNQITRGALMMFEHDHDLAVDGLAGPMVWHALIAATVAGARRTLGYSYVYVHRNVPQSLNLWHNGKVILTSPGNTGVPAAPTQLGTFPVFEHIAVGTMRGTNPDGSHYNDPGIQWISYFNHGDAIHSFNRSSFGTPQSLGCVELPLAAAAKVWPYTPIGTLVTIEN